MPSADCYKKHLKLLISQNLCITSSRSLSDQQIFLDCCPELLIPHFILSWFFFLEVEKCNPNLILTLETTESRGGAGSWRAGQKWEALHLVPALMLHSPCVYYSRLFPETPLVSAKGSGPTTLPGGCVLRGGGKGHGSFEGLSLFPQNWRLQRGRGARSHCS